MKHIQEPANKNPHRFTSPIHPMPAGRGIAAFNQLPTVSVVLEKLTGTAEKESLGLKYIVANP